MTVRLARQRFPRHATCTGSGYPPARRRRRRSASEVYPRGDCAECGRNLAVREGLVRRHVDQRRPL